MQGLGETVSVVVGAGNMGEADTNRWVGMDSQPKVFKEVFVNAISLLYRLQYGTARGKGGK